MNITLLKTEKDYQKTLARLDQIFDAPIDSKAGDEAEILSLLIDNYENEHYPINPPDPIEAIKIRMEEMGLKQKDLVGIIGTKSRVSELLSRKIALNIKMIRKLHGALHLSAALLIRNYKLVN